MAVKKDAPEEPQVVASTDEHYSPEGPPSVAATPEPSETPTSYSQEEREKYANEFADKKHGKLDTAVSNLTKANELQASQLTDALATIAEIRKKADDDELAAAKGDPDMIEKIKSDRAFKTREAELIAREAKLVTDKAAVQGDVDSAFAIQRERYAEHLIGEHGVNKENLLKWGGDTPESMEEYAIAHKGGSTASPAASVPSGPDVTPDSGVDTGGIVNPTTEQLEAMPIAQYAEWSRKQQAENRY